MLLVMNFLVITLIAVIYILILEDDFDMSGVGSTYNVSRQTSGSISSQLHNFYLVTE